MPCFRHDGLPAAVRQPTARKPAHRHMPLATCRSFVHGALRKVRCVEPLLQLGGGGPNDQGYHETAAASRTHRVT